MRRSMLLLLVVPLLVVGADAEDDPPFPKGKSHHEWAGLRYFVHLPDDFDASKEYSLIVALHGMNASETDIASWFEPILDDGFIILAPKSSGPGWDKGGIDKVAQILRHVLSKLPIGKGRLHGTGFSNGGMNLGFLVFDDRFPFATACWMGSGFAGGTVPRRARTEMAALAMAGEQDPALAAARITPKRLAGKVRRADFRSHPDLGHEIPRDLMPFYYHWMKAAEGRFHAGEDWSFPWIDDLEAARDDIAEAKRPSFFYFFDERILDNGDAKHVQNEVLLDPTVYHFGRQLVPVKIDVEIEEEFFASLGLTKLPAIVVMDPDLKPVKKLQGRIEIKELAAALRSVAKDKSPPD